MEFRKCLAVLIGLALTATGLWAAGDSDSDESAVDGREGNGARPHHRCKMVTAPEYRRDNDRLGGRLGY